MSQSEYEPVGEIVSIFQRGQMWYANFQRDGKQHRQSLKTTSKKEARRKAILVEAELLEGRFKSDSKPPTISAAVAAYMDSVRAENRAKKTIDKYQTLFDRIIDLAQRHKRKDLLGLDLRLVDAFRRERADLGRSQKTIYNETVIVRQVVNFALARKLISTDPLAGLKIKRPKPTPQPCWSPAEVMRILDAATGQLKSASTILALTGLRIGELKWLTWADVDFDRNVLLIRPKEGWRPKSGDQRAVPMPPELREMLQQLPRRGAWVIPGSERSGQFPERRLLARLKTLLKRLGLRGHLHTFRHAFISRALTGGTPEAIVRSWVGHVDHQTIALYTHIADAASQAAMRKLGALPTAEKEVPPSEQK